MPQLRSPAPRYIAPKAAQILLDRQGRASRGGSDPAEAKYRPQTSETPVMARCNGVQRKAFGGKNTRGRSQRLEALSLLSERALWLLATQWQDGGPGWRLSRSLQPGRQRCDRAVLAVPEQQLTLLRYLV
jgi:hypothetical protein